MIEAAALMATLGRVIRVKAAELQLVRLSRDVLPCVRSCVMSTFDRGVRRAAK